MKKKFLYLIFFIVLLNKYSIGQFKDSIYNHKHKLFYNHQKLKTKSYDSLVFKDDYIANAYKKNRIYYINTSGKVIFSSKIAYAEPYQTGAGIAYKRLYKSYYLIDYLGKKNTLSKTAIKPVRYNNLIFVNNSYGNRLYYGNKCIDKKFIKISTYYNKVLVEGYYTVKKIKKRKYLKDKVSFVEYKRKTLYDPYSGKQIAYNLDTAIIFDEMVYFYDKYRERGSFYFIDGEEVKGDLTKFKHVNDSILFLKNTMKGFVFNLNQKKIILSGSYTDVEIVSDYYFCIKNQTDNYKQVDIYNFNLENVNKDLFFNRKISNNRGVFIKNDSMYIATISGKRLSPNYYSIGKEENGYRIMYNKYSYFYVNDSNYKKVPLELPLLMVEQYSGNNRNMLKDLMSIPFKMMESIFFRKKSKSKKENEEKYKFLKRYGFINDLVVVPVSFLDSLKDTIYKVSSFEIRYNYLNPDGDLLNTKQYQKCFPFYSDTTWVKYNWIYYPINKKGKKVTRLKFDDVYFNEGYYFVEKNKKKGIVTKDFKYIIKCIYNDIEYTNGSFYGKKSFSDKEFKKINVN